MNSNAILALISDLYAQLCAAQDRIAELEAERGEGQSERPQEEGPTPLRVNEGGS